MPISTPVALKLHAFGLIQLHDPNWTGMDLFDRVKQHARGRIDPKSMLFRTIQNGLLYHIGLWLFQDYIFSDTHRMSLGGEYRLWYLEDLLLLLETTSVPIDAKLITRTRQLVAGLDGLYKIDEQRYLKAVDRDTTYKMTDELIETFEKEITSVADIYAQDYAQRVFHDRQLCEHVCKTLVLIGFDGRDDWDGPPKQWIKRQSRWPAWAVKAVIARDRGACAQCATNMVLELRAARHIDHIIALANAGTNDLCNLQLLCDACNRKKATLEVEVKSSVPEYLQMGARRRQRQVQIS